MLKYLYTQREIVGEESGLTGLSTCVCLISA